MNKVLINFSYLFFITFVLVIDNKNFCSPSDRVVLNLEQIISDFQTMSKSLDKVADKLAPLERVADTLQIIADNHAHTKNWTMAKSFISGLLSDPMLQLPSNQSTITDRREPQSWRSSHVYNQLDESSRRIFVQAHCMSRHCDTMCVHYTSEDDRCAFQSLVTLEVLSIERFQHRSPHYYGKCCGHGEYAGKPCYTYTPTLHGPYITCYHPARDVC